MARYELSKDDFAMLDEALSLAARAIESGHRLGAILEGRPHQYRTLAERLHKAHSAYLDEDGND